MPCAVSPAPAGASVERQQALHPLTHRGALWLQGMHCAACAGLIESAVRRLDGVVQVQVSAAAQRAEIEWRTDKVDLPQIVAAVKSAGYGAQPVGSLDAQRMRRAEAKLLLWRLFVAWFCAMQVMMLATPGYVAQPGDITPDLSRLLQWGQWLLSLPVMVFSAWPFMHQAYRALAQRRIVMEVPVALGMVVMWVASTVVTFAPAGPLGHEVVFDSLSMFAAILLAGRWVEMKLRHRSAQALERLLDRPQSPVLRLNEKGTPESVMPEDLRVGDRIRVRVGERFPADALVLVGRTEVSDSLMTGESLPVAREPGQSVWSGGLNHGAAVDVCITALGQDTRAARLINLAERAALERPPLVQMADRWAAPFLWGVLLLSALAGVAWWFMDPSRAVWVAVSVLVVTCPCALSLAAPATLVAASRGFALEGVLLQRLAAIEELARVDTVVFDKTGTLTQDRLSVLATHVLRSPVLTEGPHGSNGWAGGSNDLLTRAASLAAWSQHPASRALVEAAPSYPAAEIPWLDVREVAGQGLEGTDADGQVWRLGRPGWVASASKGAGDAQHDIGTITPTAKASALNLAFGPAGRQPHAWFELDDPLRADAALGVKQLRAQGLDLLLLSGDTDSRVSTVAAKLGLGVLQAAALPDEKRDRLMALQHQGRVVAMVGDGLNDAPVLAQAQVSIAMGQGSDATLARADIVVMDNRLQALPQLIIRARRTRRVLVQNLSWALAYNLAAIPMALVGWLPAWAAGLGMTLSSLLVVLNSRRAGSLARPLK